MHLAYRWFSRLGFEREIPDHSTFSKNRHGRFRQSGVFRKVFEEIVRRCLEAGLVEGRSLAVDGTLVGANASEQSRVPREQLARTARVSRTVQEYLTELEQQNPVQIQTNTRARVCKMLRSPRFQQRRHQESAHTGTCGHDDRKSGWDQTGWSWRIRLRRRHPHFRGRNDSLAATVLARAPAPSSSPSSFNSKQRTCEHCYPITLGHRAYLLQIPGLGPDW